MGNSESYLKLTEAVETLLNEDIDKNNDEFWAAFMHVSITTENVFEILTPDVVRQLWKRKPGNLQIFLRRILKQMQKVCAEADETGEPLSRETLALSDHCIRYLTRICGLLHEGQDDPIVFLILWFPGGWTGVPAVGWSASKESGRVEANGATAATAPAEEDPETATQVIGHDILHYLMRFLFLHGISIWARDKINGEDRGEIPTHRVDQRVVWQGGVGVGPIEASEYDETIFWRARKDLLQCLSACISAPLFQTMENYQRMPPPWLLRLTSGDVCYTANLFCSLMNTVANYDFTGWGLAYYSRPSAQNEEEILVDISLQVLVLLIDFDPTAEGIAGAYSDASAAEGQNGCEEYIVDNTHLDKQILQASAAGLGYRRTMNLEDLCGPQWYAPWNTTVKGIMSAGWLMVAEGYYLPMMSGEKVVLKKKPPQKKLRNVFRHMLANIQKEEEVDAVYKGLVNLLNTIPRAGSAWLPNSYHGVKFYQEGTMLLWQLLFLNPSFTRQICERHDPMEILRPLLFMLSKSVDHLLPSGFMHLICFCILVLSGDRNFACAMNAPYPNDIAMKGLPTFKGTYADLFALTLHKIISEYCLKFDLGAAVVEMLLTSLCNVSPYLKSLTPETSLKLFSLLERLCRPRYIFRTAGNYVHVLALVDVFTNIVQYQFQGNSVVVYAILRHKAIFEKLRDLQLPAEKKREGTTQVAEEQKGAETDPLVQPAEQDAAAGEDAAAVGAAEAAGNGANAGTVQGQVLVWRPTQEWLDGVKSKFNMQALFCLINYLLPEMERFCEKLDSPEEKVVLEKLRSMTLVGILPVPCPIVTRTFQATPQTLAWLTSFLWGAICPRLLSLPIFDMRQVKLIAVDC